MSCEEKPDLDLERDLPTTAEDVAAQQRLRREARRIPADRYLDFLASFEPPSYEELRARRGPRGEPFEL